jgi:hypothetical protein
MKGRLIILSIVLLLVLSPLAFSQSKETGAIDGTVMDQEKAPLPGVTVTASSPNLMGVRTYVTDASGVFRFPALPPGVYQLKAELPGFKTFVQDDIRVQTTVTLTIDLVMTQSAIEEEVTVTAVSPTVDVKSTETASVTLSNDILRNIPYNQFSTNIVNLAPGVNNDVAFGASESTGIAYSMDGVNVADPEAGSAWVFVDHNIIEEAKIMGLGLPAEYGNFTGVIFNLVTKSGGNTFSGHFEADFQGKKGDFPKSLWQTDNNQEFVQDFPRLTSPLLKLYDISGHIGGPIKKDKVWFYTGVQYYRSQNYPTGFPEAVDYKQPRWFGKLTAQLTPSTPITLSLEIDTYTGKNRDGGATVLPEATVGQKSPEAVGNFSLTHIFSPKTFMDVKAAYFWGYYYLEPVNGRDVNGHYDISTNYSNTNSSYYYLADRDRFQANASLTHYADDFIKGSHDFKFGVEVERSHARSRFGYNGINNTYYIDYSAYAGGYSFYGYPVGPQGQYLAYQYQGYDTNTSYIRADVFAQDSWQITSRLNVNLGLRLSNNWGFIKGESGSVFHTMRLAPRIGFSFDVLGDKTTILKAHYGIFSEAMLTAMIDRLNPASAFSDYISYYWDGAEFVEFDRVPAPSYQLADDISHPYMEQFVISVERELFRDTSFSISYIDRSWHNFLFQYDRATTWEPVDVTLPPELNNQVLTVYSRTSGINDHDFYIQNAVPNQNPYRRYRGVEFLFNKRFSNKWQLLASYIYSKASGTIDNSFGGDIGWQGSMDDPNRWINADGDSTNDYTHMAKIQATYLAPFGIYVNAYFRAITGDAWTTRYRTAPGVLAQGRVRVFAEPRGSNHYPVLTALDMRLEKTFLIAEKYRLGIILDVFNVFNNDTITSWGNTYGSGADWLATTAYPSTLGHDLYGLQGPRQARIGIRLIF